MIDRPGITSELRAAFAYEMATDSMTRTSASIDAGILMDLCDAIDSVHAALEAENERLRQDVAICSESEKEKCIDYLHKENIDWEDKYLHVAVENARLRDQIDTLVMYVEADGTKYSVDCDGNQHFDHSDMCVPDGWIELPKDADGVPWHLGDRDEDGRTVTAIKLCLDGFWIRVGCIYKRAEETRHYQPDTWEHIIEDAVRLGFTDPDNESLALKLVARCKTLAKEGE